MRDESEPAVQDAASPATTAELPQTTAQPPVQIVAFCCFYCAYAAADLAGVMRLSYPPNVRVVLLPCTGGVDPVYILRAFEAGADGVFVAGCLEGQCHYQVGNLHARSRVADLKHRLDEIGIGGARLEMFNLSSAQGPRFAEVARLMTERITALGPTPLRRARKETAHVERT
jgi:coenzyme F420-reducing hydrogenase delta subunit